MPQIMQTTLALDTPLSLALSFQSYDKAKQHFIELFSSSKDTNKIPCLNETPFADVPQLAGKLVRFRGMVQDTSFTSELYPYSWNKSSTPSDADPHFSFLTDNLSTSDFTEDSHILQFGHRYVHYLISIPGLSLPSHVAFAPTHVCKNKYPIPSFPYQGIFVKHYETVEYKLSDFVEVVGILELNPMETKSSSFTDLRSSPWFIHVIWSNTTTLLPSPSLFTVAESNILTARQQCIQLFQSRFFHDDALAANYFLLQLMMLNPVSLDSSSSSSASTTSSSSSFFEFVPLVLSGYSSSFASFASVLSQLCSAVYLPLSLQVLNNDEFAPYVNDNEDTDHGSLLAGRLQIFPSSPLLIDETVLTEGQLNEKGIKNLQTLVQLLQMQKLDYRLPYSPIALPLVCNPIFNCQSNSILPLPEPHFLMKSSSCSSSSPFSSLPSDSEPSHDFKWLTQYINWAQTQTCSLSSELAKVIEHTFVEDRKVNKKLSQNDLHLELTLARRLGQTLGEITLTKQTWEKAREMEKQRKTRLLDSKASKN